MKSFCYFFIICTLFLTISSCVTKAPLVVQKKSYIPDDQSLYDTIVYLDSVYFNAYNTCDLKTQADLYAEDLEFFHDLGGLMTSKPAILEAIQKNICDKVTRELVNGSIEVYPIKDYGAVQMGLHKFHNNQEPEGTPSKVGKFVMLWRFKDNAWQITRVISLH